MLTQLKNGNWIDLSMVTGIVVSPPSHRSLGGDWWFVGSKQWRVVVSQPDAPDQIIAFDDVNDAVRYADELARRANQETKSATQSQPTDPAADAAGADRPDPDFQV